MTSISPSNQVQTLSQSNNSPTAAEIETWLVRYVAELLDIEDVDVETPFDRYGLDSASVAGMMGDLGDWLGYKLDPSIPFDYPTIEALAKHLSGLTP